MKRGRILAGALALPAFLLCGWAQTAKPRPPRAPLGLPPLSWPSANPYSAAKVELGRLLYFDRRLSVDETVSCASCHDPRFAFTDNAPFSTGIKSQHGGRSAPTLINRAYSLAQFWDGRAGTLEEQAKGPIANPTEMGMTLDTAVERLQGVKGYLPLFAAAFGSEEVNIDRMAQAIASFERTLLSGNAAYDRFKSGNRMAMTLQQIRGMDIFVNRAKCDRCHEGSNFTLNAYSNIGVGSDKTDPDVGRFAVTKDPRDWGVFKTPTLREIEHTAPYMHDGSLRTLDDVVEYYNKGGTPNKNLDQNIRPLHLNEQDKQDLVAFMKALSGEGWQQLKQPASFPQ